MQSELKTLMVSRALLADLISYDDAVRLKAEQHVRPMLSGSYIDLDAVDWAAIVEAAASSKWMPTEYMRNEWVSDVCSWLKEGPPVAADPVVDLPFSDWYAEHGQLGVKHELGLEELMEGAYYAGAKSNRRAVREENHSRLVALMAGLIRASGVDTGDCHIDADGPDLFACAADATARVLQMAADPFEQFRQAIRGELAAAVKGLVASLHKLSIESDDREGFRTWLTDRDGGLLQVGDAFDHPYAAADWCERNGFAWEVIGAEDPVAGLAAWRAAQ